MNYLFLHGLAGDPSNWGGIIANLSSNGRRCVAPRIGYFDESFRSIDQFSERLLVDLRQNNGIDENWIVVGNSLGGTLALSIGHHFRKIILVSSYTKASANFVARGATAVRNEISRIFYNPSQLNQDQIEYYEEIWKDFTSSRNNFRMLKKIKKLATDYDYDSQYEKLQDKICLVCGEHDKISPLEKFIQLIERYPRMTISIIQECGHAAPIEQPNRLADILLNAERTNTQGG